MNKTTLGNVVELTSSNANNSYDENEYILFSNVFVNHVHSYNTSIYFSIVSKITPNICLNQTYQANITIQSCLHVLCINSTNTNMYKVVTRVVHKQYKHKQV